MPRRRFVAVTSATLVAGAAWAAFWYLAVPRHDICAMVLPAPAGCGGADRLRAATVWTVVVALLYAATFVRRLPFPAVGALLLVAAVWGYRSVLYA